MQFHRILNQEMYTYRGKHLGCMILWKNVLLSKWKNDDQTDAMSQALNRFIYYHANEKFVPSEPVTLEEKVHRHIIRLSRGRRKGGQLQ